MKSDQPDRTTSSSAASDVQMCNAADLIPDEPECLRVAQWSWQPDPTDHPYFLCNFHGEPLMDMVRSILNGPGRCR